MAFESDRHPPRLFKTDNHSFKSRPSFFMISPLIYKNYFFTLITLLLLFPTPSFCQDVYAAKQRPLELSAEEVAFLKAHPVLKMGIGVAFPPFQFVDENNGQKEFKGVAAEIVQLLENRLGIRMEPVFNVSFAEALELGRSGSIDVFPCISWTPERAEFLKYTAPYLNYPLVVVSRDDSPFIGSIEDLDGKKVADVKVLSAYSKILNMYPELKIEYVFEKDTQAMLEAVAFGKADACVVDLAVASYIINDRGLSNLKVAAPTDWKENQLAMAVPKGHEMLAKILQKGLDSISFEEMDSIRQHWFGLRYSSLVSPVLFRKILVQGGGAALLVIITILLWNRRLRKEISARKQAEESLRLANAYNRSVIETSLDPLIKIGLDGKIADVNSAAEVATGYSRNELVGSIYLSHFTEPNRAQSGCQQVFRDGFIKNLELELLNKNNSSTPVLCNASVFRDESDNVVGVLTAVRDITDRREVEAKLQEMATLDSLTGLNNRRHFYDLSGAVFETAKRYKTRLAVAIVDIDHFKSVNDHWGHEAGDMVLIQLGQIAITSFRASDVLGRIGGEEFAVVMPETDQHEAMKAVMRFRKSIESAVIVYDDQLLKITISSGVTLFDSIKDMKIEHVLKRADNALYKAKRYGRNRVVFAS